MSLDRRSFNTLIAGLPLAAAAPAALAQMPRDSVTLGVVLEPQGLDPTISSAGSIGEVAHLNIFEGLTRITQDGAVLPLLAEDWGHDEEGKTYTFKLRQNVMFSDGKPFTSAAVKFSFDRARAPNSTNKARQTFFENIKSITTPDAHTVVMVLDDADGVAPFRLGENTAVILHPDSADQAATRPVGTGPYTLEKWEKGKSLTLVKWDGHRNADKVRLRRVTFRFLEDPAAQVAALRSGSIDAMPRFGALQTLKQFQADRRFVVQVGATSGKGLLAINNRRKPFDDVRVRRALSHAVDRKAFIDGAQAGLGTPIGSHFSPLDLGYLDLTKVYPHDPARARALLREAGITAPLEVTLSLPPPEYARRGGPIIAAQLAQVGIQVKLQNLEWDDWLAGPFKGNFDLTLINHVEPLDYATAYANPDYYFGYDSAKMRGFVATLLAVPKMSDKGALWRDIQRQIADDAVNVFIWNPAQVAVARRGLRGLWSNSPIVVNDMAAVSWAPPATPI